MKRVYATLMGIMLVGGCGREEAQPPDPPSSVRPPSKKVSLAEARKGFKTKLIRKESTGKPLPEPPAQLFRKIHFHSPVGKLGGYLTPDPKDGKKHPAIIWITGGDCNSIDEGVWAKSPPSKRKAPFRCRPPRDYG